MSCFQNSPWFVCHIRYSMSRSSLVNGALRWCRKHNATNSELSPGHLTQSLMRSSLSHWFSLNMVYIVGRPLLTGRCLWMASRYTHAMQPVLINRFVSPLPSSTWVIDVTLMQRPGCEAKKCLFRNGGLFSCFIAGSCNSLYVARKGANKWIDAFCLQTLVNSTTHSPPPRSNEHSSLQVSWGHCCRISRCPTCLRSYLSCPSYVPFLWRSDQDSGCVDACIADFIWTRYVHSSGLLIWGAGVMPGCHRGTLKGQCNHLIQK